MTGVRAGWTALGVEMRLGIIAAFVAIAWCVLTLDPLGAATIDPDAASSVLYFDRIFSGQHLEVFVPTTPKPLLTIVFGLSWALFNVWRLLVWETVLVWGLAVGATAALVARVAMRVAVPRFGRSGSAVSAGAPAAATSAGAVSSAAASSSAGAVSSAAASTSVASAGAPGFLAGAAPLSVAAAVAGALFTAAALLGSSDLMLEVSRANSLIWALAGWSVAGLAVTARPIRPRLAGVALLLAGLCRFETLALAAVAVIAVVAWRRMSGGGAGPGQVLVPGIVETAEQLQARTAFVRRRTLTGAVVGAFLAVDALVLALLHDWLLTGDPLYWLSVPSRYTEIFNPGLASVGPIAFAGTLAGRLAPEWLLIALAAVGIVALARARAWLPLAGIAAVGLGEIALLFWLAFRATYISNRYYEPIDLALIVAAGVGVGWLASRLPRDRRAMAPIAAAAAVVVGIAVTWPALPWDRRATVELMDVRRASTHFELIRPALEDTLSAGVTQLLVPSRDVSRLSVETGESLTRILNSYAVLLIRGVKGLEPGQVLFHDAAADRPGSLYRPLEVDPEASVGGVTIVRVEPRLAEIWLLSIR